MVNSMYCLTIPFRSTTKVPNVVVDYQEEVHWEDSLIKEYTDDQRHLDGKVHVSDLIICMRRPEIIREYEPQWTMRSLLMFTFGKSFEKFVFKAILPEATREIEVEEDGIVGHIDFGVGDVGTDDMDFECKLTWTKERDDPNELFDKQWYWLEQAGTYAVMRRRYSCRFAVIHIPSWPMPTLRIYKVTWTKEELGDLWSIMQKRKEYYLGMKAQAKLPHKTQHTQYCKSCPVEQICGKLPEG